MTNNILNKILQYWDLNEEQINEINNPQTIVYKNDEFKDFMSNANRLMICGDYDCDGVTSTSIAVLLAQEFGLDYGYYIPNRLSEGYGLSEKTVELAKQKGYTDLLLVDNGVKAHKALNLALSYGMNVAVVDHHIIDEKLDDKILLIHPDMMPSPYFDTMSAGGIMFSLAEGMGLDTEYMEALAALSTVADVMPLWGKNREIVRRGVEALNKNYFLQFDYLVKRNRFTKYRAELLAFQVSPKINSIGRMADIVNINTTVEYFLSDSEAVIKSYAQQVFKVNTYRKDLGTQLQKHARQQIDDQDIQIITSKKYHEGLLGIVANHISQETGKPSIILREYEDIYKGSARSMNVSLEELFSQLDQKYFTAMGGHDFAYGMSVKRKYFEEFQRELYTLMETYDFKDLSFNGIEVNESDFSPTLVKELQKFEPLGEGLKLPLMKMKMPDNYNLVRLNGHGYKMIFNESEIAEGLLFNKHISESEIRSAKEVIFKLNLQSPNKIQIYIEELSGTVV